MREDRQLLVIMHLSQLLDFVSGIGGFIVPLVIWLTKKDDIIDLDTQGKEVVNFRISMFLYVLICIPLIILLGLGILGLIILSVIYLIFPIINAIRVSNHQQPNYPFVIKFIN